MKQHITPKQAEEITEEQFYSLFDEIVKREDYAKFHHQKMNIGKMIEILNTYSWELGISIPSGEWLVETLEYKFSCKELCDALWQAVKQTI